MKCQKARKLPSLLGFKKAARRNGQETHGANQEDGKPDNSSYWQEYLRTPPSHIELPLDYAKQAGHIPEMASETIILPESIAEPLKELSATPGIDLCSVMLAGFYTLLNRYCAQEDIIIALTFPDYSRIILPENESGNRFFLPLRLGLEKDSPFQALIAKVGNALSEIHDCLAPMDSEISHDIFFSAQEISAITQLAFTYLKKPDLASISSGNAPFPDLALAILDKGESLSASLRYDRKLFAANTIKRMLHHYCNLLLAATKDPLQTISQLEMLSEKERHQVLVEWNRTYHPCPQQDYLHQMFESHAEKTPDAVAIVHLEDKLSYLALNRKANRLAHYLRAQGLKPGNLVGIFMERSIDAVIAILGVLKAGGAYLPLDAGYPKERLNFIIKDSRASFLITHERHKAGLGESAGTILCLDSLDKELSKHPNENPAGFSQEQDIAFVLYTSGSTGNPKGVQVTHKNMINNCFLWEHTFQLSSTITAICQMAFFSFAVFQGDLFRALYTGKKLVVCPNETLMSPHNLYELMQQEKIDFAEFVPTILRELSHYVMNNGLDLYFMKVIIVSADRWYVREHKEIKRLCGPSTSFVHVYGLSETSLDSTFFMGTDLELNPNQLTPIGRPFPNVRTYILDEHHQPVPVGITGELYIGGAGVAKGYHHRPDLTNESFMADPFSNEEHDRIFRTGDLARYLPDGNIAFLGRGDQQIKIRGFRVEPGEIEDQLTKHFQVRNAIVQPWEPAAGVIQLVAYYVAQQDPPPPPETLRAYLGKVLPDFMIPSRFIPLESLPLTPSGKVNRNALPQPTAGRPELEQPFIAPKGTTEELIAALWRDLLQIDDIGALDNLFDLGGTSLLCIQTVAMLAQQHNIDIPVTTIFQHPTVRALAQIIDKTPAKSPARPTRQRLKRSNDEDTRIAIIAEAGRFPGANTIEQFWQNLRNGVESISFFSDSELDADSDLTQLHNPHFVKARGIVADAELFDAPFFGISPLEAKVMDPQQRLFLEIAYEAMERAGYNPKNYAGKIGVFAGSNNNSYFLSRVQKHPDLVKRLGDFQIMIANEKDYIATGLR
jgi:amino acid adenylation domain-containing protein